MKISKYGVAQSPDSPHIQDTGTLVCLRTFLSEWQTLQRFDDHELSDRVFLLCIGNGWSVGGGLILTPDARLDDGLLDLTYIRNISRFRILRVFTRLFDGTIYDVPEATPFRSSNIKISSPQPLPIHVDGEALPEPSSNLEIELLPAAQPVIGNWDAPRKV